MNRRFGLRQSAGLLVLAAATAVALTLFVGGAGAVVAGAGFTTTNPLVDGPGTCFNGPGLVNCNIYSSKSAVWINGGPTNGTSALSDGTYFFVVGVPGGENSSINDAATVPDDGTGTPLNLSDDFDAYTNREFIVQNHHITVNLGSHDFANGKIRLAPYSDTTNPGGEYFVGICQISTDTTETAAETLGSPANPSQCKYDNFKVHQTVCVGDSCNPTPFGTLSGEKYYDANLNGQLDQGEVGIPNWAIDFTDGTADTLFTDVNGQFTVNLSPDTYTFTEEQATNTTGPPFNLPEWLQTGNTVNQSLDNGGDSTNLSNFIYTTSVVDGGSTSGLNFGNVCLGAGGGLTLGYWSNKNGQADMTNKGGGMAANLAFLSGLNLRNASGGNFDPTTYAQFRTWLLGASATNMAYMLSAQLAAMELNVRLGYVSGSSQIYVSGVGFVTITSLMNAANTDLATNGLTLAGNADRAYQQKLETALDSANNNVSFVQSGPSGCPAPTFP